MKYEAAVDIVHDQGGTARLIQIYCRSENASKVYENAHKSLQVGCWLSPMSLRRTGIVLIVWLHFATWCRPAMHQHEAAKTMILEQIPDFDFSLDLGK